MNNFDILLLFQRQDVTALAKATPITTPSNKNITLIVLQRSRFPETEGGCGKDFPVK